MPKKILVTGTNPEKYKKQGEVVHHPLIELVPVPFVMPNLSLYDWVVFTSRFAVKHFFGGKGFKLQPKVAAIGSATARALANLGIRSTLVPKEESSSGLLTAMRKYKLRGKRVLIPGSNLAGSYLDNGLRADGAMVDRLVVYKNVKPKTQPIDLREIDEIIFSSPSTVRNFISEYGLPPAKVRVRFRGKVTENEFSRYQA
jgi:uroporphyrinogen-III synthase